MTEINSREIHYGTGKKKLSVYIVGVILCVILTLFPYYIVLYQAFSAAGVLATIFISAILQFLVQVIFFLRLNTKDESGRINVMTFIFTIIVLAVVVGGTLWIMWSLQYYMSH